MSTLGAQGLASDADQAAKLESTVIRGGFCIGCGACACDPSGSFSMKGTSIGTIEAERNPGVLASLPVLSVCPFSDQSPNEDELAAEFYGDAPHHDKRIGKYRECFAGHVTKGAWRDVGASGGMGTWVLAELLRKGEIDAAIHVRPRANTDESGFFVEFAISRTQQEILDGAKSRYHPIEMSGVVELIRRHEGRYAFVGVPCFVKAMRLLQRQDPVLRERVVFTLSLFCGHLKSINFARMFGWQLGIEPNSLESLDFRVKDSLRPANDYGVRAVGLGTDGQPIDAAGRVRDLYGFDWGLGYFKYKACDYCDDIVGEVADMSIGDAWINPYMRDGMGTNIIITRSALASSLVKEAMAQGTIVADQISVDRVADSQAANYRHRHTGLAYRLWLSDQQGEWRPPKRIRAGRLRSKALERTHELRMQLRDRSHSEFVRAVERRDFAAFRTAMEPLVREYDRVRRPSAVVKYRNLALAALRRVLGKLRPR